MPATYRPDHRAHIALGIVERTGADLYQITAELNAWTKTTRDKAFWVMDSLLEDGFVTKVDGEYFLTEEGARALARLRAGEIVCTRPVQSVRIFVGRAA